MEKIRDIRLQAFLPMTGTGWPIGGACLPAHLLAVRQVNEREGLLDGYNISYSWADTKVRYTAGREENYGGGGGVYKPMCEGCPLSMFTFLITLNYFMITE